VRPIVDVSSLARPAPPLSERNKLSAELPALTVENPIPNCANVPSFGGTYDVGWHCRFAVDTRQIVPSL
jgi:hypothetical protein